MKTWPDCIPCILKMSLNVAYDIFKERQDITNLFDNILAIESIQKNRYETTPPEIIRDIWKLLIDRTGITDLLYEKKRLQNSLALNVYPYAKESVIKSYDPFKEALKWSIGGNFIDIMAGINNFKKDDFIRKINKMNIDEDAVYELRNRFKKSKKVIYFCDNCGEIVFDRLFGEILKDIFKLDIFFVVRSVAVLNDATKEDAFSVGLNKIGTVLENGIIEPLPGFILEKASSELIKLMDNVDLIISKGGGNFDTLSEKKSLKGKVSFLLQAKCRPYVLMHGIDKGNLIVYNF